MERGCEHPESKPCRRCSGQGHAVGSTHKPPSTQHPRARLVEAVLLHLVLAPSRVVGLQPRVVLLLSLLRQGWVGGCSSGGGCHAMDGARRQHMQGHALHGQALPAITELADRQRARALLSSATTLLGLLLATPRSKQPAPPAQHPPAGRRTPGRAGSPAPARATPPAPPAWPPAWRCTARSCPSASWMEGQHGGWGRRKATSGRQAEAAAEWWQTAELQRLRL